VYLIAEIGAANLFISFVSQQQTGHLTQEKVSHYLFICGAG